MSAQRARFLVTQEHMMHQGARLPSAAVAAAAAYFLQDFQVHFFQEQVLQDIQVHLLLDMIHDDGAPVTSIFQGYIFQERLLRLVAAPRAPPVTLVSQEFVTVTGSPRHLAMGHVPQPHEQHQHHIPSLQLLAIVPNSAVRSQVRRVSSFPPNTKPRSPSISP